MRKFSHSCSDAWEAAANLAVDEALEQCSGATDDFARCEINSYENYVHDICEGNPSDYSDYVDGLATRTTCRVLRGQS
ncbi:MAG: hypothetical protein HYU97_02305 [Deltaproteobacteria bacterium]|nr:hypothetical protein [Deltaproteobacteria bacterium]